MRTIDLHTHILPPSWPDLAEKAGTRGWPAIEHLGRGASGCDCEGSSESGMTTTSS
jgi:hypothetical protein